MLGQIGKGLLGRLLGYAGLGLGFWLLFQGFLRPNPLLGILGGGAILGGMYMMVAARRSTPPLIPWESPEDSDEEPTEDRTET